MAPKPRPRGEECEISLLKGSKDLIAIASFIMDATMCLAGDF